MKLKSIKIPYVSNPSVSVLQGKLLLINGNIPLKARLCSSITVIQSWPLKEYQSCTKQSWPKFTKTLYDFCMDLCFYSNIILFLSSLALLYCFKKCFHYLCKYCCRLYIVMLLLCAILCHVKSDGSSIMQMSMALCLCDSCSSYCFLCSFSPSNFSIKNISKLLKFPYVRKMAV